eukprot:3453987-Alexandrium_andersonii.AAC.1
MWNVGPFSQLRPVSCSDLNPQSARSLALGPIGRALGGQLHLDNSRVTAEAYQLRPITALSCLS